MPGALPWFDPASKLFLCRLSSSFGGASILAELTLKKLKPQNLLKYINRFLSNLVSIECWWLFFWSWGSYLLSFQTKDGEKTVKNRLIFKGIGYFLYNTINKSLQIFIKLTRFKDIDGRKLSLKYYFLRCCSFWEMSKTISHKKFISVRRKNYFSMYDWFIWLSWKHCSMLFKFFFKNLATNKAETSTGKLYYIHLHSQWVGIPVMAKQLHLQKYQNPFKDTRHYW